MLKRRNSASNCWTDSRELLILFSASVMACSAGIHFLAIGLDVLLALLTDLPQFLQASPDRFLLFADRLQPLLDPGFDHARITDLLAA
jgi:hypothetical protein